MTFREEFPDFDPATLPAVPVEWEDISWHNDSSPSWDTGKKLIVHVDYADISLREYPDGPRYFVINNDGTHNESLLETDSWDAVLLFVSFSAFNKIRAQTSGPKKKFQLIKEFGEQVRTHHEIDNMTLDPRVLSCAELEECIFQILISRLAEIAAQARCLGDDDWGSERQIAAFNAFNIVASTLMTSDQHEAWEAYSMKASSDEIVDEAMRLVTPSGLQ